MPQQSLNTFQPENSPHGTEISILAKGPAGDYVAIGEIFNMDWTEDNMVEDMPVMGSRVTGSRQGRYKITGTIKAYWINGPAHSMWFGAGNPAAGGSASTIYHSRAPFQRYNIRAVIANAASGFTARTFVNVIFDKDTSQWQAEKFTEETIGFRAEDVLEA